MNKVYFTLIFLSLTPHIMNGMDNIDPLMKALFADENSKIKELLAQHHNPNVSYKSLTALQWSVVMNKYEIVPALLSYGADITVRDSGKNNLLHLAVSLTNVEIKHSQDIVEALLCCNISRTDKDMNGKTPLEKANNKTCQLIKEFDNRPKSMLVFLQTLHSRLGSKSPANTLTIDGCQNIFSFLRPDIANRHK